MRKILFALVALAACAGNSDTMTGGDDGSGSGSGSGSGTGSGSGGGDVSAADKQRDYDDTANALGANLVAGDLGAMVDSINMAFGRMPAGFAIQQGPDYQLLTGTRGNLTITYRLYCRDDLDAYAPCNGAENHAHIKPTMSGSATSATASMNDVNRTAGWIVRDLALPTPRIGGDGTNTFTSAMGTSNYTLVVNDNLNHVLFQPTPGAPVGGKIDITVNVTRTRPEANPADRTFDVTATIQFDGSDTAVITLDGAQIYNLTLSTGAVVKA